MKLTSCDSCGIVLDFDCLEEQERPEIYYDHIKVYACPLCGNELLDDPQEKNSER
jgi:predicted RNA-binding Zn-ribbon protein involved in translation (DUF1610 family)